MSEDTRQRIMAVLESVLGPQVDPQQTGLALTSLKMLEVVVGLETEFGITISEDAPLAEITASLASIHEYVEKMIG